MNYPDSAKHSRALHERAKQYMPGGNTRTTVYIHPFPLYVARGEGCRIWDIDGRERIDSINNFTSQIHGHSNAHINAAVRQQLELGTCFGMPTTAEVDLAQVLVERIASIDMLRFTNSGTEAVMMALKAARAFTGRSKIAKVEGAYHGSYDYAEVSLDPSPRNWGDNGPAPVPYAQGTPQRFRKMLWCFLLTSQKQPPASFVPMGRSWLPFWWTPCPTVRDWCQPPMNTLQHCARRQMRWVPY